MVTHQKTISRDGPSMKGKARDESADENGVVGAEHKVPLSEAVLKAVGLYGGTRPAQGKGKVGTAVDLRDQAGAIYQPAPEAADDCQSAADVVAYLSAKHKGYFERTPVSDSEGNPLTTVRFTYGDGGDIVTGAAKTTKGAVKVMAAKLPGAETFDCLEGLADV